MTPIHEHLHSSIAATATVVDGIGSEQWAASTTCDDWRVRQLVEHLVGG